MNATTRKEAQYKEIRKHRENLNAIFNTGLDPILLCKKLRRLETKAHHATTCLCNTNSLNMLNGYPTHQATEEEQEEFFSAILDNVHAILGENSKDMVFINYDPRGYALKIREEKANGLDIHKDWGGYGIICPEINQ